MHVALPCRSGAYPPVRHAAETERHGLRRQGQNPHRKGKKLMGKPLSVLLPDRALLIVRGADARPFLQGLISHDVTLASRQRALWAAFLTPQGRYLHDFFLIESDDGLLLEGERERLGNLRRRLAIYKLRSQVTMEEAGDRLAVWALIGRGALEACGLPATAEPGAATTFGGGMVFVDSRLAQAGARAVLPDAGGAGALAAAGFAVGGIEEYDRLRLSLGLPDGSRDIEIEKALLLECGFDELHGVDWRKGCYLGQELTARTRYRGLVKRRLVLVSADGAVPPPGTPITLDGKPVGEVRSGIDGMALAMLRLDALDAARSGAAIEAGGIPLAPRVPEWAVIPQPQPD